MPQPRNEAWIAQLTALHAARAPLIVFLINGIKLSFDRLEEFDDECLIAVSPGSGGGAAANQIVRYQAISTVVPNATGRQNPVRN